MSDHTRRTHRSVRRLHGRPIGALLLESGDFREDRPARGDAAHVAAGDAIHPGRGALWAAVFASPPCARRWSTAADGAPVSSSGGSPIRRQSSLFFGALRFIPASRPRSCSTPARRSWRSSSGQGRGGGPWPWWPPSPLLRRHLARGGAVGRHAPAGRGAGAGGAAGLWYAGFLRRSTRSPRSAGGALDRHGDQRRAAAFTLSVPLGGGYAPPTGRAWGAVPGSWPVPPSSASSCSSSGSGASGLRSRRS
jgi:hypothetical protein